MLKTVNNRNFQEKSKEARFKSYKKGTPKRIIFKEETSGESTSVAAKVLETVSGGKSLRIKNTIKPAGLLKKKYSLFNSSAIKLERTSSKYASFTDISKVSEMCETSESAYASFENSKSDLISNNSMSRNDDIKMYDLSENDYIPESSRKSSFRLKSPKLFSKPEILHQVIQPSFAINDFKIGKSKLSSSDFSFTIPEIKEENDPAMSKTAPKVPNSPKNDYLPSCDDQMFHLSETRRNEIFSWVLSCNQSNSDDTSTMKFDDDSGSSIDFSSLKYEAPTVADILLENYCASDVELQTDNSTMPTPEATKSQTFIDSSFDSVNNQLDLDLLDGNRCSHAENERSLPYRKRQIQWHTCPDSLESALTTEAEKLNEIKNYL
ncbi:uncharacterized protein LOC135839333 [Planococcus citri]|uniref:uncharacterized protein LOC135839333 n=1 Tax=Planococcus citri TaxID=170843 RepID=UPI0031F91F18